MRVAILWHFHQPVYRRAGSFSYILPWVNYHVKNYHQMLSLAEEAGYPCTFNVVPCLIEQILDYAEGRAVDPVQAALEKDPAGLTESEIALLRPFAPGESGPAEVQAAALKAFLSPVEEIPKTRDACLAKQKDVLGRLVPELARLGRARRIELTASPYYHPLTPLIFDLRTAFGHILPRESFHYPGDALLHLEKAVSFFEGIFGFRPAGLWPSEGAVSRDVTRAAAGTGFPFAVTDENVLWKSLGVSPNLDHLRTPYRSEGLPVFFRDRLLSDLIGFEYSRWDPAEAAADLVRRIEERGTSRPDDSLVLALDGENPWETYADNGVPFLRELFSRMLRAEGIQPSFFGDILGERGSGLKEIELVPGTWLGSFAKWIGDEAKNEGWNMLSRARRDCGPVEEILVAEGSDWFWWRGEDHPEFEALFREHLASAYAGRGLPVPRECRPEEGRP